MTGPDVFIASRRWSHHAPHSGYDLIGTRVGGRVLTPVPLPGSLVRPLLRREERRFRGYDLMAARLELAVAWHMCRHRNGLYHLLYADDSYNRLGPLVGWRGHRVIASYHHPPAKLAQWIPTPEVLAQLSGIIVLGRKLQSWLRSFIAPERAFFVPHGIDTTYFHPGAAPRESHTCVCVGAHLRDFETLRLAIQDASAVSPRIRFIVVGPPEVRQAMAGTTGRLEIRTGVPEPELRTLLQTASLLVLPLHDAVANGALLEGLACGIPVVVTDVGDVRDYVDERMAVLVPPYDAAAMLEAIGSLLGDPDRLRRLGEQARARARALDWDVVAVQTRAVYEAVRALPPVQGLA